MSDPMLDSPFTPLQLQVNPDIEFGPWGDYKSPEEISTVDEENLAVRNNAVMFDMSPVNKYSIKGDDATRFLNFLTVRQMDIEPGRVTYTCWCNPKGKIIDDGTVFRLSENEYRLYPAAPQLEYFRQVAETFDVTVEDVTHDSAALTVQGPKSFALLKEMGIQGLEDLRPFRFAEYQFAGETLRISRTGFSGDLGYELWMETAQAETVWNALLKVGVQPMGMQGLLNMRLEAALLLPDEGFELEGGSYDGNDDVAMTRTPFEVDLAWLLNWDKGDFIGREALLAEREQGSTIKLIGLELEGSDACQFGDRLFNASGADIGMITSGTYSIALKRNIALASVRTSFCDVGDACSVKLEEGNASVAAKVVERPFFNDSRKSATPPQSIF